MKANMEKIESNIVTLTVEVEAPEVDRALNQAYRKLAQKYNIPGFRRGRVPRRILENYIGKSAFYNEAVEAVIPEAYVHAVEETQIEPIDQPEVEVVQVEEGQPLVFKATVEVKPEVRLGEYRGLKLQAPAIQVTEADINKYLAMLQDRHARLNSVEEGEVQVGDTVLVDYVGTVDAQEGPEIRGTDILIETGSGRFIPGFEEQLIGARSDSEVEVRVTFPADYFKQELSGKDAVFAVKIKGIKRKELLPLDDEFAKDVSEFETLEELRADAVNKLKEASERAVRENLKNQAIASAMEFSTVELPAVLVNRQVNSLVDELEQNLKLQGLTLQQYFEANKLSLDELRSQLRPQAETRVKADLVMEAIARAEGITAGDEEVEEEIKKVAEGMRQPVESVRRVFLTQDSHLHSLKDGIVVRKTVDLLVDKANLETVVLSDTESDGAEPGDGGKVVIDLDPASVVTGQGQ